MASSIPGRIALDPDFALEETVIENIATIPIETKKMMGYQADEFIVDCTFAGSACRAGYVKYIRLWYLNNLIEQVCVCSSGSLFYLNNIYYVIKKQFYNYNNFSHCLAV